ncbi:conserved hypothetical protein [Hyella patelloides LEGE 07179]|uniref:Uncharacterized protein n=1 Tax=Hyella patelloides LEGE 07179 TaxID=945734 RepID=A0A563VXN4_9CYAN|nr:conserved hypothetical protein [Hyella patelloides LEGE 07179]
MTEQTAQTLKLQTISRALQDASFTFS